jgi:POT family proton-dependent oligopeptide transporter
VHAGGARPHAGADGAELFWLMTWIGLGCALLAFFAAPLLRRAMHGLK